ncbi:MAG: hypothetical protein QXZ09_04895 [Candidatus Methanomethylicaceae archaeon]
MSWAIRITLLFVLSFAEICSGEDFRLFLYMEGGFDERRVCLYGSSYNPETNRCEKIVKPNCPPGTSYVPGTGYCVKTFDECRGTYDPLRETCYEDPVLRCPPGSSYDSSLGVCVSAPVYVCPPGTRLDPSVLLCVLEE